MWRSLCAPGMVTHGGETSNKEQDFSGGTGEQSYCELSDCEGK